MINLDLHVSSALIGPDIEWLSEGKSNGFQPTNPHRANARIAIFAGRKKAAKAT
jgi:hypothetical protein